MRRTTLVAVGDIAFSERIERYFKRASYDYPFKGVKSFLSSGDLIFGNLESPITDASIKNESHYSKLTDDPILGKRVYLKSSSWTVKSLKAAGFNVLSIANNHILDYGCRGLRDTIEALTKAGILHVGAGLNLSLSRRPAIFTLGQRKIGFLAYSYTYEATKNSCGCTPLWRFIVKQDVKSLRDKVDIVVVSCHYGKEFSFTPSKFQRSISHFAIDCGADIVLGHHPHVIQPIEIYKGKIIMYSLGNFLFDYNLYGIPLPEDLLFHTRLSVIVKITIHGDNDLTYDLLPIYLDENFQLKPVLNRHKISLTDLNSKSVSCSSIRKTALLFRLIFLSLIKGNKLNLLLLASRALNECGLL